MTLFRESGLSFEFDSSWIVKKYDAHRYYTYLSGVGLKAVDFVGIHRDQAYLFEVKNYQIRFEGKPFYKIYDLIDQPEQLIQIMLDKVHDTRRGIRVVHEYLSRKWLYRLLYPWLSQSTLPLLSKNSWWFWARLYYLLEEQQKGTMVLSMATETAYENHNEQQVKAFLQTVEQSLQKSYATLRFQFQLISPEKTSPITGLKILA